MAGGGVWLLVLSLPVARSAWQAQKADSVMTDLRLGHSFDIQHVRDGAIYLGRAIAIDPLAGYYLERSELLGGAGLTPDLEISQDLRMQWLRRAKSDLEVGLANAPARGVGWLRLAAMDEALDGPSRAVLPPLFLSIDYAALIPQTWYPRLRIILDCWPYLDAAQKQRLTAYVGQTWRVATDRQFFITALHSAADELIVRYFLRDEPGAQEQLTELIKKRVRQ